MVRLLLFLLFILTIDFFFVNIFEIKFGKALPVALTTIVFLMFVAVFRKSVWSYPKYAFLLWILSIAILIVFYRKKIKTGLERFLNPGLLIFTVFYFYLYYLLKDSVLCNVDDFYYWGSLVRDCINNNQLYDLQHMLIEISYPPFITLINVVFNICLANGYVEGVSIFSSALYTLSFFLPIFDNYEFNKKSILGTLLSFVCVVLASLCIQNNSDMSRNFIYTCTYSDWIIAVMTAYLLFLVYRKENSIKDNLYICILLTALLLTKSMSVALFLLVVVACFVAELINKNTIKKTILGTGINVVIPLVFYKLWLIFEAGEKALNSSSSMAVSVAGSIASQGIFNEYRLGIYKTFLDYLLNYSIINHPFKVNYTVLIVMFTVLMLLFSYINKSKKIINVTIFYFLGAVGYALMICLSFAFIFPESEATCLTAYGRYMQMYTYIGLVLFVFVGLDANKGEVKKILPILLITMTFIEPASLVEITPLRKEYYREERVEINYTFDTVLNNKEVSVISTYDFKNYYMFRYLCNGRSKLINTEIYSEEMFKEAINDFQYIIVGTYDDDMEQYWNKYSDETIFNAALYEVVDGKLKLVSKF